MRHNPNVWQTFAIIFFVIGGVLGVLNLVRLVAIIASFNELVEAHSAEYVWGMLFGSIILPALFLGTGALCLRRSKHPKIAKAPKK